MWLRFYTQDNAYVMRDSEWRLYPGFNRHKSHTISRKPSNWITTVPCSLLSQAD
jgi:hypothetical protein